MSSLLQSRINFLLALFFVVFATVAGVYIGVYRAQKTSPTQEYTVILDSKEHGPLELQYGVWPELAHADFFTDVRLRFIEENADFVEADLTHMTLRVFKYGAPVLTVPIISKGREGSWWETPSGLYKADVKKENHLSSFGNVYTQWNIPFQGNFFIHGWPYYPDGTPVPEGYSGGCIRLRDADAKNVYDLVEVGMPILVFEEAAGTDSFTYLLQPPQVSAQSYLVADLDTNFALLAGETESLHETSIIPKVMTALVASEYQNIEKYITVTDSSLGNITPDVLIPGTSYRILDLLFPLMMEGSFEAAQAITSLYQHDRILELLSTKAASIGMRSTIFTDGAGVTAGNTTTAGDVFLLLKYLHTNRPFILAVSAGAADMRAYGETTFDDLSPSHPLADIDGFEGGVLDAEPPRLVRADNITAALALVFATSSAAINDGQTGDLVTVLSESFNGVERHIAIIVLDSKDPATDSRVLRSYASWLFE